MKLTKILCYLFLIIFVPAYLVSSPRPSGLKYQEPKKYKVELVLQEWDAKINQLEAVKNQIKQSDISYRNAAYMIDSIITPLQQTISSQINLQIRAETAAKVDSTKPKKK